MNTQFYTFTFPSDLLIPYICIMIHVIVLIDQCLQSYSTTPLTWISPDLKLVLNLCNCYTKLGRKIISTVVILMRLNNELIISVLTFSKIYSFISWHCVIQSFESLPEMAEQRENDTSSSGDDSTWLNWELVNNIYPNTTPTNLTDFRPTESWNDEISRVFQRLMQFEDDWTLKKGGDEVSTSFIHHSECQVCEKSHWFEILVVCHDAVFDFMYSYDW